MKLFAQDLAQTVTQTIVDSADFSKLAASQQSISKQKNTDTVSAVAEELSSMVKSLGLSASLAAGGYIILVLLGFIFVPMLIMFVVKAIGGILGAARSKSNNASNGPSDSSSSSNGSGQ